MPTRIEAMQDSDHIRYRAIVERPDLSRLVDALKAQGYRVIGPTVRDGAIVYAELTGLGNWPRGQQERVGRGHYRLESEDSPRFFDYTVPAFPLKSWLLPERECLLRVRNWGGKPKVEKPHAPEKPLAFMGVRPCDFAGVERLDRIFGERGSQDGPYGRRRTAAFFGVVHCATPGPNCFCTSTETGPRGTGAFDWGINEILHSDGHYFVIEAATEKGERLLESVRHRRATDSEVEICQKQTERAAERLGRKFEYASVAALLERQFDHSHWARVGDRCLSCANCTEVCPTCYCTSVEDSLLENSSVAERHRVWDSCFHLSFSQISGGSVRYSTKSRYRHWLAHKFLFWVKRWGSAGCVGCGRCITWCPVGIDVRQELEAFTRRPPMASTTAG